MSAKIWPEGTPFRPLHLIPHQRTCELCGRFTHVCDHRYHRIDTLSGPLEIIAHLTHCPDRDCLGHRHTLSPEEEYLLTWKGWSIGWDVFAHIGFRRFDAHWKVPMILSELDERFHIHLSDSGVEKYLARYQTLLAARQSDPETLKRDYREHSSLVLTIDGLQPEKGHETLYVVRELRAQRIWFAEALLSSGANEILPLFERARKWADTLGLPVTAWMSDKQSAFLSGVATVFPGVPHLFCRNHFIRDAASEYLKLDSSAVATLRTKIRGLREVEKTMLPLARPEDTPEKTAMPPATGPVAVPVSPPNSARPLPPATPELLTGDMPSCEPSDSFDVSPSVPVTPQAKVPHDPPHLPTIDPRPQVILDYCAGIRGVLNDSQGGPLSPPSLRMALSLTQLRDSMLVCRDLKKGGLLTPLSASSSL